MARTDDPVNPSLAAEGFVRCGGQSLRVTSLPMHSPTQRTLLVAVVLSVCMHGLVLLPAGSGRIAGTPTGNPFKSGPITLHLVKPATQPAPQSVTAPLTEPDIAPEPAPSPVTQTIVPVEPEPAPLTTEPTTADSTASESGLAGNNGQALLGASYYSAQDLTIKPVFMHDNGAPTPTFIPDVFPLPVLVSVYINEQGSVDEVVLAESFLSDVAKQFIVDSFLAMQFTPGLLGTLPVKSVLITEVKLNPALPHR